MTASLKDLPQHPLRSLLAPLTVMESLGFDRQKCLLGTGIMLSELEDSQARMSLQQELGFYRNVLELTNSPTIGLKMGECYAVQVYGLFGYAMLSAATFRHTLSLAQHFGRLTFSIFSFDFGVKGKQAWFSLLEPPPIEQELINFYLDRDIAAAKAHFTEILNKPFEIRELQLTHGGHGQQRAYREYFNCDVLFSANACKLVFDSNLLDRPLPQSDPDSSRHLQQQCQMLIAKMTSQSHFIDDVRMLILGRPGFYPDIDFVAERLGISARTLRRRLKEEGSTYRELLDEVRFGLAREYLGQTQLQMDEISSLLGYTESGNFSHAFRRWSGMSPSDWRIAQTN